MQWIALNLTSKPIKKCLNEKYKYHYPDTQSVGEITALS